MQYLQRERIQKLVQINNSVIELCLTCFLNILSLQIFHKSSYYATLLRTQMAFAASLTDFLRKGSSRALTCSSAGLSAGLPYEMDAREAAYHSSTWGESLYCYSVTFFDLKRIFILFFVASCKIVTISSLLMKSFRFFYPSKKVRCHKLTWNYN